MCQSVISPGRINISFLERRKDSLTIGLLSQASAHSTLLLEVDMPALCLAGLVLQREGVDAAGLLDGIFPVGFAGVQGFVDGVEGRRGRELVCRSRVSLPPNSCAAAPLSRTREFNSPCFKPIFAKVYMREAAAQAIKVWGK